MTRAIAIALIVGASGMAWADGPQRPGPGGKYTSRRLVVSPFTLFNIYGPLSPALFGHRVGSRSIDGGIYVSRARTLDPLLEPELGFFGGVMIGMAPGLEFGAIFAPVEVVGANNFKLLPPPVIATYARNFGPVDVGVRLNLHLGSPFKIFPGVPVRIRLTKTRIDTGVFPSIRFQPDAPGDPGPLAGLNLPVRVTRNLTPHLFAGLETGFAEPAFTQSGDEAIPLGLVGGYTFASGASVVDFNLSFVWDNFILVDPAPGVDAVQVGVFRFNVGLNIQLALL